MWYFIIFCVIVYALLVLSNFWSTRRLQKMYGYSWNQILLHMRIRTHIIKSVQWNLATNVLLVNYIKGRGDDWADETMDLGDDDLAVHAARVLEQYYETIKSNPSNEKDGARGPITP